MGRIEKLFEHILLRKGDANVSFVALCNLLKKMEFAERTRGDHHIFTKNGVEEILNIQPKGNKAKAYQVKQIRNVILRYSLKLESDHGE